MIQKYIKITISSPEKILKWSERNLPNGKRIGQITKSKRIKFVKNNLLKNKRIYNNFCLPFQKNVK